jgi:D-inositol-3-phosphate glycosyltransferase
VQQSNTLRHVLPSMNVLFILEFYAPSVGGGEVAFQQLAERLAASGHGVTVITTRLPGTSSGEVLNGVTVVRVPVPAALGRYAFTVAAIPSAIRLAAGADVLHTAIYNAAPAAALAARLRRKPGVITVHEVFGEQWQAMPGMNRWLGYAYRAYERLIIGLPFDAYVTGSRFTRQRLLAAVSRSPDRVRTIAYCLDDAFWSRQSHTARPLRAEHNLDAETFLYLFFGRPGVSKGLEFLLQAVPRISEQVPKSKLVLILSREPRRQYRAMLEEVRRLRIEDRVLFLESVPRKELPGYLLACDCVVVPSLSEGFGYSAIEAATLGCPVIATSGHAVEEFLSGSAVFVAPRDSEALADAVAAMARARPSLRPPRRFSVEDHTGAIVQLYEELLSAQAARRAGR